MHAFNPEHLHVFGSMWLLIVCAYGIYPILNVFYLFCVTLKCVLLMDIQSWRFILLQNVVSTLIKYPYTDVYTEDFNHEKHTVVSSQNIYLKPGALEKRLEIYSAGRYVYSTIFNNSNNNNNNV